MADEPTTLQVKFTPEQMRAMLHAPVARLYANGFGIAQTAADISIILMVNGAPSGVLTISMTTAKTLTAELGKTIEVYEQKTNSKVNTIDEVATSLGISQ